MGDRTPTSFNLDDDHREWFESQPINRSDLVNELISEYRAGQGEIDRAIKQMRLNQLQSEIHSLRSELDRKQEEKENVQESMAASAQLYDEKLDDVLDLMENRDLMLDTDTPRLQSIARDHHGDAERTDLVLEDLHERADDRDINDDQWPDGE